jgi:hypothetical protein
MTLMKIHIAWIVLALSLVPQGSRAQQLVLVNPLAVDRSPEVVEVPLRDVRAHLHLADAQAQTIVAEDTSTGQRIPSQIYSAPPGDKPDTLLLLVRLRARASIDITFRVDPNAPAQQHLVFGREAPERKDDFAWENELVAYRVYGPALQAAGEVTSGIDVWSKRTPNFVIDSFYKRDLEGTRTHNPALSYHKDNGQGLDSYYVGPTRGCGGTAVLANGQLYVSKNYTQLRTLADGPIRFAFQVSYAPWDADGITVSETKRIILDAGTHLNRIESTYSFAHSAALQISAGIAVHDGARAEFPVDGSIAAVWDTPQDSSAGRIATGLIAAPGQHAQTQEAAGHALLVFRRRSGQTFIYYAGSGWSKADMPDAQAWDSYLKLQLNLLQHPIRISWNTRQK